MTMRDSELARMLAFRGRMEKPNKDPEMRSNISCRQVLFKLKSRWEERKHGTGL